MWRPYLGGFLIGAVAGLGFSVGSAAREMPAPAAPFGEWTTQDGGGVIAIGWCGTALCGRIVGIKRAPGEQIPNDVHGRSQCGLTIITGGTPSRDGAWLARITDPRDGTQYHAELWVDERDWLHLRGFIGIPLLGRTEIWRPFTGRLTPECGVA